MSSVLQEGHPIYQDTRDGLPVGWAAGDEAFLSGVGNPPAPEALPASDLSVQLQFWSQYQAEHQRAPTELLSGYCPGTGGCCITLVGLYGGPLKTTSAIRTASLCFVVSAFASELGYDSQGLDWLYAVE